jgi:hypothetical protein
VLLAVSLGGLGKTTHFIDGISLPIRRGSQCDERACDEREEQSACHDFSGRELGLEQQNSSNVTIWPAVGDAHGAAQALERGPEKPVG